MQVGLPTSPLRLGIAIQLGLHRGYELLEILFIRLEKIVHGGFDDGKSLRRSVRG